MGLTQCSDPRKSTSHQSLEAPLLHLLYHVISSLQVPRPSVAACVATCFPTNLPLPPRTSAIAISFPIITTSASSVQIQIA